MRPALELRDLHKSYRAGRGRCVAHVAVLRGASLQVGEGELVALVGGLGAGKTTLLLCAAGLLAPDAGTVVRFGRAPASEAEGDVCYVAPGILPRERPDGAAPRLLLVDGLSLDAGDAGRTLARLRELARAGVAVLAALGCAHGRAGAGRLPMLARMGARVARLEHGRVVEAGAAAERRVLELRLASAAGASRLSRELRCAPGEGALVRVPLDGRSAEEVLAHCLTLRVDVVGSRVVREAAPGDASARQGGSVDSPFPGS